MLFYEEFNNSLSTVDPEVYSLHINLDLNFNFTKYFNTLLHYAISLLKNATGFKKDV